MAGPFNPLALVRRRPLMASLLAVLLAILLLIVFLRFWVTTDSGRDFVISQIDGRDIAGYGRISVRNLEGDPLSEFTIGNVEIRDASGQWFNASGVRVDWSPLDLLARTVNLSEITVDELNVRRRPVRTPRPETTSEPWAVRLERGEISRLLIAEGVAGPASASSVSARFINERSGSIDALLEVKPLEGAGDEVIARLLRERTSEFDLVIDGVAPAGGLFAHLLGLPETSSAMLAAKASGNLDDGRGEATLTIDNADKVFLSGKIENRRLEASARVDAGALPLPELAARFIGNAAEAELVASFEKSAVRFDLDTVLSAGTISLSGVSSASSLHLLEPADVDAKLTTLAPYWNGAKSLTLLGSIEQIGNSFKYAGQAGLDLHSDSGLPLEAVAGTVTASFENGRIPFSGDVNVTNLLASNPDIAGILGEDVRVSGSGVLDLPAGRLVVSAAEVTHRSGDAQLLGEAGFVGRTLNVSGRISQQLSALPGGFGGRASGFIQAKGELGDIELGVNLNLETLSSTVEAIDPLVRGRGSLRGLLQIKPESGFIKRLDFKLSGVEGRLSGPVYGAGSPDLSFTARQLTSVTVAGNSIDLAEITGRLRRSSDGLKLSAVSANGTALVSGRSITGLAADVDLLVKGDTVTGPVTLAGQSEGLDSSISFLLDRNRDGTSLRGITGNLGAAAFSGSAQISDEGAVETDLDVEAGAFEYGGVSVGSLKISGTGVRSAGDAMGLGIRFDATMIRLTSDLTLDSLQGTLTSTPKGYRFDGTLLDRQPGADSNMKFSGEFSLSDEAPAGTLTLAGTLLGIEIGSREDITWKLGPAPELDADLSLLGGQLQAQLRPGTDVASSNLVLRDLKIEPLLVALGLPPIDAVVSGNASGRVFGENPEGRFRLTAVSGVSGLDTELYLTLMGILGPRQLALTAEGNYGPQLKANAAGKFPVIASPSGPVRLDRDSPIEMIADINGNLNAVRLVALAYGHDIGGTLTSRLSVNGSLNDPAVRAEIDIADGLYEYGATGLSLKDLDLNANYDGEVLTLSGTGAGSDSGTLKLDGRLAEDEAGIAVELNRILVYDRLGDYARISGKATLTEGETARILGGNLSINDARFDIDNFGSSSIRTLNVRWTTDDLEASEENVLEKPILLDLKVTANRGVLIRGRGLDSDWGVNLDVTGQPDDLVLNGRATLVRGSLELAQRPFEFESGSITFDGPVESARMAVSATREVDGFSVRADVSGSPSKPTVELTSTPSLPEDEILSRMLFGRSSVDLTALEAAELATSIARLAGQNTGMDPLSAIQNELGVDRLRFGVSAEGNPELGVGQYLAPDVYLEVTTQGAAGNSVEVEWQPRPQVSVSSETSSTGDSRVSVRWKKDY